MDKKAASKELIAALISILIIIVVVSIIPKTNAWSGIKNILNKYSGDEVAPEDTIYLCKDSDKHICVVSEQAMKDKCEGKFIRKYEFEDDWVLCENEACLENNPAILDQVKVYFVPLHKNYADLGDPIVMANAQVRNYAHNLEICPGRSQIVTLEVDDCTITEAGFNQGIYCYDSNIYSQIEKCVQKQYPSASSFLVFAIDNYVFAELKPETLCSNYDNADNQMTSYANPGKEVIIMQRFKMAAMNGEQWKELLQQSKLLGRSCVTASQTEPLSKQYPQCKQEWQKI